MSIFGPLIKAMREAGIAPSQLALQFRTEAAVLNSAAAALAEVADLPTDDLHGVLKESEAYAHRLLAYPAGWRDLAGMFGATPAVSWPTVH